MDLKHSMYAAIIAYVLTLCSADTMEIYNTKLATSDLQWDKHSILPDEGWEEVSGFDRNREDILRSYQICRTDAEENDNWIRSPYIDAREGKRIYLDVEFSISPCSPTPGEEKSSKCKETFNIFYYEADRNVASSTFPPWHENPYVKVDTVAANAVDGVNKKTFTFGPLHRKGFYIAIQDQGACMALISLRVYYYYCYETTKNLAVFPNTISDVGVASLVTAHGVCVENARPSSIGEEPLYRCSSNGKWQIPTGQCICKEGYQADGLGTRCNACREGTYKIKSGSGTCVPCPRNSGLLIAPSHFSGSKVDKMTSPHNQCPCYTGYARAANEDISMPCTKPPSAAVSLVVTSRNATSARLLWSAPLDNGGRNDVFYSFQCEAAIITRSAPQWQRCPNSIAYLAPMRDGKFFETFVLVGSLTPHKNYRITVHSGNGASVALGDELKNQLASQVELQTKESVPSQVSEVKVTNPGTTTVALKWRPPKEPNGKIQGYEVELKAKRNPVRDPLAEEDTVPVVTEVKTNRIQLTGLEKATAYQVRIRAKTSAGYGQFNQPSTINTMQAPISPTGDEEDSNNIILIIIGICGVLALALLLVVVYRYRKSGRLFCLRTSRARNKTSQAGVLNEAAQQDAQLRERLIVALPPAGQRIYVEYPDPQVAITKMKKEINPKDIRIEELIGTGEFSEVCRGKLYHDNQCADVAVKKLKPNATKKDQSNFLREASTMAQFNDPNIVQLKGVVLKNQPVMIISEYMEHRSLDGYLKLNKGTLSIIQLTTMLKGIASGMRYLASMKYVHRDLAARNILLNSDLVCKVSDFGLSRTLENDPHATYTTQGGKIAIRWTALESILFRQFTSASDVWSFGIVMWEVMSYGEKPYWDMSNDDVVKNIQKGMRLPSPVTCPKILHDTMVDCWQAEPAGRPTFGELAHRLDVLLREPGQLVPTHNTPQTRSDSARAISTPNLGRAMNCGEVDSVEKFLEVQRLSAYAEHFRERGIDNLEKVSNLTINDLKAIGIDVTLHINKLENGIRTLKRHLSTCSPPSSTRASTVSDEGLTMTVSPQDSVMV